MPAVPVFIDTNSPALATQNHLAATESALNQAMTQLSSGYRINTAADDAAGYSIVQDLTSQANGLSQASNNAQDAVSLIQTADGALNDVEQMLQRIRELAVEYNGGALDTTDRNAIVSEVQALACQIDQVATQTKFNGIKLFPANSGASATGADAAGGDLNQEAADFAAWDRAARAAEALVVSDGPNAFQNEYGHDVAGPDDPMPSDAAVQSDYADMASLAGSDGDLVTALSTQATDQANAMSQAELDLKQYAIDEFASLPSSADLISFSDDLTAAEQAQTATVDTVSAGESATLTFQVGANAGDTISVTLGALTGVVAGLEGLNLDASDTLSALSSYIDQVSSSAAELGAVQNRLGYTLSNLSTYSENLQSAAATIEDADMATEMTELTKDQILQQAGISMLSQAQQAPQAILKLLS